MAWLQLDSNLCFKVFFSSFFSKKTLSTKTLDPTLPLRQRARAWHIFAQWSISDLDPRNASLSWNRAFGTWNTSISHSTSLGDILASSILFLLPRVSVCNNSLKSLRHTHLSRHVERGKSYCEAMIPYGTLMLHFTLMTIVTIAPAWSNAVEGFLPDHYSHQFFAISASPPFRLVALSPEFCFSSAQDPGETQLNY